MRLSPKLLNALVAASVITTVSCVTSSGKTEEDKKEISDAPDSIASPDTLIAPPDTIRLFDSLPDGYYCPTCGMG